MKMLHVRSGKPMTIHNPLMFLAADRELADEAWAGDIIGIPNHGTLRIGDALTEGEQLTFTRHPEFSRRNCFSASARTTPMRAKHLGRALEQLAEEGVTRVFKPRLDANWVVGVVGALQFDVLADRIRTEYEVPVHFEHAALYTARWVEADNPLELKRFAERQHGRDRRRPRRRPGVFLARNAWHLSHTAETWPQVRFSEDQGVI